MEPISSAIDLAKAIKADGKSILIKSRLLELTVRNLANPLRLFAVLPLSSIAGVILVTIGFLLFFCSTWILMLLGLLWLDGNAINLCPAYFFCVKAGATLPPAVIGVHAIYALAVLLARGGGVSSFGKIKRMQMRDMPKGVVALECDTAACR